MMSVVVTEDFRRHNVRTVAFDIMPDPYRDALQLGFEEDGVVTDDEVEEMRRIVAACAAVLED